MADSLSGDGPQRSRRSRTGCNECRRRHWKCDEAKPSCSFCQTAARACVYSRQISWGGRQFRKSRFGSCLKSGATVLSVAVSGRKFVASCFIPLELSGSRCEEQRSPTEDFVYTCSPQRTAGATVVTNASSRECNKSALYKAQFSSSAEDHVGDLPRSVTAMPISLPPEFESLFDYFVHAMTVSISCHKGIQDEICSVVVPMALEVPYLLSATLALAAAHRQTSGLPAGDCQFEWMKGRSLKQLRLGLDGFSPTENDQILATILLLCMAEVISPTAGASSWRSHLYGAATIFAQADRSSGTSVSNISVFLRRKYRALQAVALACCSKKFEAQILPTASSSDDCFDSSDDIATDIDDLAGYSTDLRPIFEEINNLERTQNDLDHGDGWSCDCRPAPPHFDCNSPLEHKSHVLFDRIRSLMAKKKKKDTPGKQRDGAPGRLPEYISRDLCVLDEAYHHMALLQVFRRGSLSVPASVIDDSRRSILHLLSTLTYQARPCPSVAALPPLFVAGILCSEESDRAKVRDLLKVMWVNYGMGNVRTCRSVLQEWWRRQDETPEDTACPSAFADWLNQQGTVNLELSLSCHVCFY